MIPALGFIVGAYVITQMLEILVRHPKAHPAVAVAAAITLIGTLFALLVIFGNLNEVLRVLPPNP